MTDSLSCYLRNCRIERNDIIPIISERSPYYIIGTLVISKAGGAFLPIDKKLPLEHIQYILEEVNPKNYSLLQHSIYYDYKLNSIPIQSINELDDTYYVLFTSGTIDKPKGVLISHF
ncbi:acetyl-CoA synthetase-like protein [Anaeromyces robustus]|uniref:Acetyl-CoA synthetase-like protein n=1 Tax=Anaeromyces robustus TaxID=1754192 RepID=A0A1Y1WV60_9FUNG|nr:acetyl-CoA synthetase-like protein [Anaeromyces robustus]|eukprot:ORX77295.1 acetyl-CoA synthetase-like protein [Anaeromyces robustus]